MMSQAPQSVQDDKIVDLLNAETTARHISGADLEVRLQSIEIRTTAVEVGVKENTSLTTSIREDTRELLELWRDAGVVFKLLRKVGAAILWLRNVALAAVALYVLWRYGSGGKP